ncbi:5'-3' exonuclease H3TH domain-containing protein, partial [Chloroflexota bacterium]
MDKPLFVVFDGNAIVHRAYHAFKHTRPLTVPHTGELVSAVFGFAQMVLKTLGDLTPKCTAVAFDMKGPTFRHREYELYKAHRPPMPDDLANQLGRVRELVEALNIPIYELPAYEADDVIGALCRQAVDEGMRAIIITGDADAMQLVSSEVGVLYPKPGRSFSDTALFDADMVKGKFGVGPELVADYKGLVGDKSDNIPGVPGVGEKTALTLLLKFGDIESIYQRLDEVMPPRVQALLQENRPMAELSKKLATIDQDAPVVFNRELCVTSQYDREQAAAFFAELGFKSL